jgi:membrane associated rhomboid family serine protease
MAYFQDSGRPPAINAPASVLILIAILVLVHAARMLLPAVDAVVTHTMVLIPAAYTDPTATLIDKLVPPLGHIFVHASWVHLGVNSVWLLAFGPAAARRFGTAGFYLFFLICGLAGAAGFVLWNWGQYEGAIGASGAISGVMAGSFRMLPGFGAPRAAPTGVSAPLAPVFSGPIIQFAIVWLVLNIVSAYFLIGAFGEVHAVAWEAHMGGFLAGLFLAGPFDRVFGPRRA